jgi:hypothetical protein
VTSDQRRSVQRLASWNKRKAAFRVATASNEHCAATAWAHLKRGVERGRAGIHADDAPRRERASPTPWREQQRHGVILSTRPQACPTRARTHGQRTAPQPLPR